MAHKQVLFRSEAREKILRGTSQLADAVRVTLGPRSKSVLIEKKWGAPVICNDGVTIAKEFDLKDPEENLGARMLRQAAEKRAIWSVTAPARRRSSPTLSSPMAYATSWRAPARSMSSAVLTGPCTARLTRLRPFPSPCARAGRRSRWRRSRPTTMPRSAR